jgi:hypothetical protein
MSGEHGAAGEGQQRSGRTNFLAGKSVAKVTARRWRHSTGLSEDKAKIVKSAGKRKAVSWTSQATILLKIKDRVSQNWRKMPITNRERSGSKASFPVRKVSRGQCQPLAHSVTDDAAMNKEEFRWT